VNSLDAVGLLRERLTDELVVSSLGTPSYLLNAVGDRPLNFYMWAAMGMASSVGLGLAIARPDRRVVVLDGDGAALMNLGGLVTTAWRRPANLLWLVLDNGVFQETGNQPIATAHGADLVAIARGAGIRRADAASDLDALGALIDVAWSHPEPTLIVAKVEPYPTRDLPILDPIRIKHRFQDALGTVG
jgi:thiamine pyrophosphate-dependent acetolactate synthase large subunit-like protein